MARPDPAKVERVAVLGAGTIGASWTAQFLARGLAVAVHDPAPDCAPRVRAFVENAWPTLKRLGLAANADPSRISFHDDPAAAVEGVPLVQENGPENLEIKCALFAAIEPGLAPEAVVASSTSGFMPSELQAGRAHPERYVVGHPFNPPHLIPLVEVVGGRATDPAVVDWAVAFYAGLGKRAIRIRREVPGHVANRMQVALYREAIHLVMENVASIEDVDAAIAHGPGLRWALMGPHMAHHLAGGRGGLRHLRAHRAGHRALVERSRPAGPDPGPRSTGWSRRSRAPRRGRSGSWKPSAMRCWWRCSRACRPPAASSPAARKRTRVERTPGRRGWLAGSRRRDRTPGGRARSPLMAPPRPA